MSAPLIQAEIEDVIRAALRKAVADQKISVPVRGFWTPPDEDDKLLSVTPAIYVMCKPYSPLGADGDGKIYPDGTFSVEVKARWNGADETGNPLQIGMWRAVHAVVYHSAFSPINNVSLAGCVIIEGSPDAGADEHGAFASVSFTCSVNVSE